MAAGLVDEEQEILESYNLETQKTELDDDGKITRTGTVWTASAHIITAIIGSGVLSLAWAVAQLGWVAGIGTLLIFAGITLYTSALLADCYRYPDPVTGKRNYTYMEVVKAHLGGRMHMLCGLVQYVTLSLFAVSYTITTSTSMVAIGKSNCFHKEGHEAKCKFSYNPYMVGFGIAQIFVSQIPNLHKLWWLSILAATMSFGYASIGMGLSLAKIVSGSGERTTLTGREIGEGLNAAAKVWTMFRAIGDIAFASTYTCILIEVQDTLRSSPPENKVMKKANSIAVLTSTTFYLLCGCLGYAAFGNEAPGNLLTGFGFYEPFWLIDMANLFIVIHLIGGYQVASQPVFIAFESWASKRWPKSRFVTREYPLRIGNKDFNFSINCLRLTWRTAYVVTGTVVAMALPFFNDIIALLGAIAYWPLSVYFPIKLHIRQSMVRQGSIKWLLLQLLNLVCLLVAIAAASGAIEGLYKGLKTYKPFKF
ncbi:putative amino acid transporter [Tripterygium wilfordii]|uniref:Putative amino acid transporter n=1 Tax=Tripterygium wilfordii TaxID=458696 RepID=A0A7J7DPN4_TRIWF|nr:amino acid permease 8-like [Tripterygium wilfordii]KAF5748277.1 putative amino acid transporter [Tripterygium wilfordii]